MARATDWAPIAVIAVVDRWPLRLRLAATYAAATAAAVVALGVFLDVRTGHALEDRRRDSIALEAERIAALSPEQRVAAVTALPGDPFAQVSALDGRLRAASRLVPVPLVARPGSVLGRARTAYVDREVVLLDDDAAARRAVRRKAEHVDLQVRRVDDGYLVVGASRQDDDDALAALRTQLLVGSPLVLGLAALLGYVVAGLGLRPVERMQRQAATISARTAGERLPVPVADDELRRLALTLNAMLVRLEDGLERERRFVAEASHDLRTPLTLVLTEIELALEPGRSAEELQAALVSVRAEVRRLADLSNDLLERAAGDGGSVRLHVEDVDLGALAGRVADRFRAAAGGRAVVVTAPVGLVVRGDVAGLDRVVSNLVDNAIKHGAGDVGIDVSADPDRPGGASLTVSDGGRGLVGDDAAGIGLAIAEELVRAHGGRIGTGRNDGRTVVRVDLPRGS